MQQQPLLKRLLSYLYPVKIQEGSSTDNPVLELFLYRGQYQLATEDAVYSDGTRYKPLILAFNGMADILPRINSVLVLGTGLGSAVDLLYKRGYMPSFTLVEKDALVLEWASGILSDRFNISYVCADAEAYMQENKQLYDLLIVDVFISRKVPAFVSEEAFLQKCRQGLHPGGKMILNYIIEDKEMWEELLQTMNNVFPRYYTHSFSINGVIVATA